MRRKLIRLAIIATVAALTVGSLALLIGPAAHWLASYDKGGRPTAEQVDAARGRLFQIATALVALGVLWYTSRNHRVAQETHRLALGQHNLAERGQVAERFAQAIEQLGSVNMDVRIGAIYILERIARDSAADHPAVMEVLSSFVRRKTSDSDRMASIRAAVQPAEEKVGDTNSPVRPPDYDVQAALTVIGRRNPSQDHEPINLFGATLAGAHLEGAHLQRADMRFADLREAHLHGANLNKALLYKANLAGTYLHGANVSHANLRLANMEHVWANRTDFRHAIFWGADLRRADLHNADLRDADLSKKETPLITPPGSEVSMTHLKGRYPVGWKVSSDSFPSLKIDRAILLGAQLAGANLHGVEGLTRDQVNSAANYSEQTLPEYLREKTDEG